MTNITKPNEVKREWIVLDAEGEIFGRLLTKAATLLRGKHKPCYTPNVDCGDNVIIVNASKATFTGNNKAEDKLYHRHSGYFGSVKSEKFGGRYGGQVVHANPLLSELYKKGCSFGASFFCYL